MFTPINPLNCIDFYKADHRRQYPDGTTEVYSNFTARSAKLAKTSKNFSNKVVFFGLRYFILDFLVEAWNKEFFSKPKEVVVSRYKRRMDNSLGKDSIDVKHMEALHDLQYLPIRIKALSEGSLVPIGVPMVSIVNTHPDFFWLTNYLESVLSCYLWKPITTATIAHEYKVLFEEYCIKTGGDTDFCRFQGHDFSFRGMSSLQDSIVSGAAHMLSFVGTDTVSSIDFLETYYDADTDSDLVGCSVPATEHSVMCMGGKETEIETFRRLINVVYPTGIVSIVSDTWDFYRVLTEYLVTLKPDIMKRNGKVVIRPDSGDPVKIILGDKDAPIDSPEYKGAVKILWELFGGTLTKTGDKLLDNHIGLIYGDSITIERAQTILEGLYQAGYCSTNIVFGIGSYTYQYVTRDTFGFAVKSTSGVINGQRVAISKSPKTDSGVKKSAVGLLMVDDNLSLHQNVTPEEENLGLLKTVFEDGRILSKTTYKDILENIKNSC